MARAVSYEEQTLNSPNPITRFAHRSRYKVSLDLGDKLLPKGGVIVDFGAGQGTYLAKLHKIRPEARLIAIEPYMAIDYPFIESVMGGELLKSDSVDLMTAFECLEHVTDEQLSTFLENTKSALKPRGHLLVTVPIMYGLMLPVKEMSRAVLHRRLTDTGAVDLVKASFGRTITRATDRLTSHRGFDFRWLKRELAKHFTIDRLSFSPFGGLPWWLNSQAVFVCRLKE